MCSLGEILGGPIGGLISGDSPLNSFIPGANLFSGSNTPNYGSAAASAEAQQEALINAGTSLVNAVYGGGTANTYSPVTPGVKGTKGTTYYNVGKTAGSPDYSFQPLTSARQTYWDKHKLPATLYQATPETFTGFNQDFYNNYYNSYVNQAQPQLGQQYQTNRNALTYTLADRGLLGSSSGGNAMSQLQQEYEQGAQGIANTGQSLVSSLKQNIQSNENTALSQIEQSTDPSAATASAINTAASFQPPSTFQPLANAFAGIANQYYTNALLSYNPATTPGTNPSVSSGGSSYLPQGYGSGTGGVGPTVTQ